MLSKDLSANMLVRKETGQDGFLLHFEAVESLGEEDLIREVQLSPESADPQYPIVPQKHSSSSYERVSAGGLQ